MPRRPKNQPEHQKPGESVSAWRRRTRPYRETAAMVTGIRSVKSRAYTELMKIKNSRRQGRISKALDGLALDCAGVLQGLIDDVDQLDLDAGKERARREIDP